MSKEGNGADQATAGRRKDLMASGVLLGDVTLALAGVASEIPQWAGALDVEKFLADPEARGIMEAVEKLDPASDTISAQLAEMTVDRAIARGKYLSATRCLEILVRKDAYVDKYIALAQKETDKGGFKDAADALAVASSLELNEGTPLFQYTGPALHDACTTSREKCVTAVPAEAAVLRGLQYLLEGPKACEAVGAFSPEVRKEILPYVALARDPDAHAFYRSYKQAHADIVKIEAEELANLASDLKRVADAIGAFSAALASATPGDVEGKDVLEGLLRTAGSLKKDFSDLKPLLDNLELRRIRRRFEELSEGKPDIARALSSIRKGSKIGSSMEGLVAVVEDFEKKGILEAIDSIEEKILATQVTMLGRPVHSQEHWQYLRALAFKYPVSPLMCCVRRVNAKWMVVPAWESDIVRILAAHFDK